MIDNKIETNYPVCFFSTFIQLHDYCVVGIAHSLNRAVVFMHIGHGMFSQKHTAVNLHNRNVSYD